MKISRRYLLSLAPTALAVATLPKQAHSADWSQTGFELTREELAGLINSAFRVQFDSGDIWLTLLSVEDSTPAAPASRQPMAMPRHLKLPPSRKTQSFSLRFQYSGEPLKQGTYLFEHRATGPFPLFIVPSGNLTYIAIINRLVE